MFDTRCLLDFVTKSEKAIETGLSFPRNYLHVGGQTEFGLFDLKVNILDFVLNPSDLQDEILDERERVRRDVLDWIDSYVDF